MVYWVGKKTASAVNAAEAVGGIAASCVSGILHSDQKETVHLHMGRLGTL